MRLFGWKWWVKSAWIPMHERKEYIFIIGRWLFILTDAEIWDHVSNRIGSIWGGAQMQRCIKRYQCGNKEIQGLRWWRTNSKNHHARGKDLEDALTWEHCGDEISIQEKRHCVFSILICWEQPAGSFRKKSQWPPSEPHTPSHLSVASWALLPTSARYRSSWYQARKLTCQLQIWYEDLWFRLRTPNQKGKRLSWYDWLCGNTLVPTPRTAGRWIVQQINWSLGCRLHYVLAYRR